jgi:uncharacterized membrane protein
MSMQQQVREQLKELGMTNHIKQDVSSLGLELTVCQMIVVLLSIGSVVFLFVPLFYLQNPKFMVLFFGLSFLCMVLGVWFWIKKAEYCEHPEDWIE